jgi:hypothetical protein
VDISYNTLYHRLNTGWEPEEALTTPTKHYRKRVRNPVPDAPTASDTVSATPVSPSGGTLTLKEEAQKLNVPLEKTISQKLSTDQFCRASDCMANIKAFLERYDLVDANVYIQWDETYKHQHQKGITLLAKVPKTDAELQGEIEHLLREKLEQLKHEHTRYLELMKTFDLKLPNHPRPETP